MSQIEKVPIESVRATCPGSYMFKIQSFSLLSEFVQKSADVDGFKSPEFESSGHKWKLSIHPDGNKKLGVEDHISLYLVAEDADIDSEINVIFKMSVYDHFRDNFLTIQDGEVRRFHGLKKEWGFARLISIERFKDANNGYLVNDCCVFGVQIFVLTSGIRSGNLVMIKQPIDGIFTWKLDKFSTLKGVVTKEFKVQGHEWKLQIYPNGDSSAQGTHLSMYLRLSGSNNKSYISCVLRVRDQVNGKHQEGIITHYFGVTSTGRGFNKFILLSDLKDKTIGFILNDSLIVEVEVNLISKEAPLVRKSESVRASCPGSFMFKIQSFSAISEFARLSVSYCKCFESPEFESNGHKWKLSIYPNGDEKLGVKNHISLYLVAADDDDDIDSVEFGISVTFKMFVFDHLRDNFLTIQDNEVKRFNGLKREWGFARLISLNRFKDANNGYLVNDCCVFGVEISLIPCGNLLMIKQPSDGTFTWKLEKFSTLSGFHTKDFQVQGHEWKLKIYPNGDSLTEGTHISMFLCTSGIPKSYIRCVLRVRDQVNGKHHERTVSACFDEFSPSWGYSKFILLSELKNKSRGFILKDSLIAEAEVKFMTV